MNIQFNYTYRGNIKQKYLPISEVIEMIRNGKYDRIVDIVRQEAQLYAGVSPNAIIEATETMPYLVWSYAQDEKYTGLVMLSLPAKDEEQLENLRNIVNAYLQVICSFKGSSGRSLKVIMAYDINEVHDITSFHANAYSRAAAFLLANTGVKADGRGAESHYGCRISSDPKAYYNENAIPIILPTPSSMSKNDYGMSEVSTLQPKTTVLPGYNEVEMEVTRFNLLRRRLNIDAEEGYASEIIKLAESCAKADIKEEIAIKCTLMLKRFEDKDLMVRSSFEQAYATTKPSTTLSKNILPKNTLNLELMKRFLKARYRFRQNEMTGSVEYSELFRYVSSWRPLTDRDRNTICMEALRAGIEVWDRDINRYINSTLIETYDPMIEWMTQLPQWDGRDRLGELAATVKTNWLMWPEMFRTWMRSMVSQWRGVNRMYGATMVLMLTGSQGTRKSSFCKRILPPELMSYYIDRLDFTNKKDAERALTRFCLINLDEFDQISSHQTAFLKHILQKSNVAYRKMYQDDVEQRRRYAAFCATTNSETPLTDPTGSRRYMVIEVTEPIDTSYEIDYPQLYAQVTHEIRHDMPTYFDSEMERLVQEHNANYTEEMPLATMFRNTFEACRPSDADSIELTPTEVLLELKEKYKTSIAVNRSTATQLGKYLYSCGIRTVSRGGKRIYILRKCDTSTTH